MTWSGCWTSWNRWRQRAKSPLRQFSGRLRRRSTQGSASSTSSSSSRQFSGPAAPGGTPERATIREARYGYADLSCCRAGAAGAGAAGTGGRGYAAGFGKGVGGGGANGEGSGGDGGGGRIRVMPPFTELFPVWLPRRGMATSATCSILPAPCTPTFTRIGILPRMWRAPLMRLGGCWTSWNHWRQLPKTCTGRSGV